MKNMTVADFMERVHFPRTNVVVRVHLTSGASRIYYEKEAYPLGTFSKWEIREISNAIVFDFWS